VIEHLLGPGESIDTMSVSTWRRPDYFTNELTVDQFMLMHAGGQTALNVAQISGDMALAEFLISKGADPNIQPVDNEFVEEFPYLGEFWP
jgi:hypothetical protein